ncbi:putative transcriptional activator protein TraR [Tritonibacter multivorans]|uniref:Putative transcriptional activator protein TraR n=1 Tax=Tritonibacter multivorans TaxID=928856 RepID=A0A0N7LYV5_9RHOB|nr:autoinducer binding domain-containing protein [Tritonibacter multivorans]MDA7419657.1 autoinducer binding domain-containing protein [Tritonibacter multivorans]CUH75921.1 putative transcriptional activator protein TraR [Tritonibacter multivorans]SFC58782.1 transcriptional regulator, LuxR family [Tritonibacter multivorans]
MARDDVAEPDGLDGILAQIERLTDLSDVPGVLHAIQNHFELAHVAYLWIDKLGGRHKLTSLGDDWKTRYIERDYFRADPVLTGCFSAIDPVDWRDLNWSGRLSAAYRRDAMSHGVGRQGYSVPLRGPGGQYAVLSVTSDWAEPVWDAFKDASGRDLILLGHYLNRVVLELSTEPDRAGDAMEGQALSPRELASLALLAEGKSRAKAAEALDISEHTLRVYIETARKKLGAQNTTHAVAKAVATGLIAL